MQLSKEAIKEFREIYRKEFKEEIDEVVAQEKARRLLNLFKVIYKKPLSKDEDN
jgi:hypothetical protein